MSKHLRQNSKIVHLPSSSSPSSSSSSWREEVDVNWCAGGRPKKSNRVESLPVESVVEFTELFPCEVRLDDRGRCFAGVLAGVLAAFFAGVFAGVFADTGRLLLFDGVDADADDDVDGIAGFFAVFLLIFNKFSTKTFTDRTSISLCKKFSLEFCLLNNKNDAVPAMFIKPN